MSSQELSQYVTGAPELQAKLMKLELMPERIKNNSRAWNMMVDIVDLYREKVFLQSILSDRRAQKAAGMNL